MGDERVAQYQQDAEVDRRVDKRLKDAGINKPEDLQTGRADVGMTSRMLGNADPQLAPLLAEKEMRDAQWAQAAGGAEQPAPVAPPTEGQPEAPAAEPQDRLSQLQQELDAARVTEKQWKLQAGEDRNRVGDLKKRLQELEHVARNGGGFQQSQPQPQFQYQQPVMPQMQQDSELTQQGVMNLMLAQSQAFGQQLAAAKEAARREMIDISRGLQGYTLTSEQEADLQERNPWLLNLQHGEREKAMMSLTAATNENKPSTRARQAQQTDDATARGQVRTFQYVEPSTQGSPVETATAAGEDSLLAQKAAKVRELLNTPGKSDEAEALLNEITPGGRRD